MGILGDMRERAGRFARRALSRSGEAMEKRLGIPLRAEARARSPHSAPGTEQGPAFRDAPENGLAAWLAVSPGLERVGHSSLGLLQARLTEAELAFREALERIEGSGAPGDPGDWKQVTDGLATLLQDTNARLTERWRDAFVRSLDAWAQAGQDATDLNVPAALATAAARFDAVWLDEWEKTQQLLEDLSVEVKQRMREISAQAPLNPTVSQAAWARAIAAVDGGLRRIQGDLWGTWGTQAGLVRGCARKAIESGQALDSLYGPAFTRMEAEFEAALRSNVQDLRDSWLAAADQIERGIGMT